MKTFLLFTMVFLFSMPLAFGQRQATTQDGKKVLLFDNGTWKYVAETKTSIKQTSSHNCSDWVIQEVDKVGGLSWLGAKTPIIASKDSKNGLKIGIIKPEKGSIILSIDPMGAGRCIDKGDKINILFTDGSRLELSHDGKFNCDPTAVVYFRGIFGKESELEELKTKKISTMRVWTSSSYVEEDFTAANADAFLNILQCLDK